MLTRIDQLQTIFNVVNSDTPVLFCDRFFAQCDVIFSFKNELFPIKTYEYLNDTFTFTFSVLEAVFRQWEQKQGSNLRTFELSFSSQLNPGNFRMHPLLLQANIRQDNFNLLLKRNRITRGVIKHIPQEIGELKHDISRALVIF